MPSLYIILDGKIPGADIYLNGNFLSKHNDELEMMAKRLGVTSLMSFFSISKEELSFVEESTAIDLGRTTSDTEEKWFTAEEGLSTVNALLGNLAESKLRDVPRVESELREFAHVLELARAHGIPWHLGIDY